MELRSDAEFSVILESYRFSFLLLLEERLSSFLWSNSIFITNNFLLITASAATILLLILLRQRAIRHLKYTGRIFWVLLFIWSLVFLIEYCDLNCYFKMKKVLIIEFSKFSFFAGIVAASAVIAELTTAC